MTAPESASGGDVEACCEHSLRWHHEERGCGYHGYAPEHRCPCLLTFDEALAADRARVRAETLAEVEQRLGDAFQGDEYQENAASAAGEGEWSWFKWLATETVRGMAEAGGSS